MSLSMYDDLDSILLTEPQIKQRVLEIGTAITNAYRDNPPLVVCILKGSAVFFADLIRSIDLPVEIDFMAAASYGNGTVSSGEVVVVKDLAVDITGRNILLVEDIIDSGRTLSYLKKLLLSRNAREVSIVTLLDKPSRRAVKLTPDFCGFTIPDAFVVGYGLDYAEKYRNLRDIGILSPRIYEG